MKDPLGFYHQKVLGVRENQTLEVTINNMDKGNLVHKVLEALYKPYQNKFLKPSDYNDMRKKFPPLMEKEYQNIFHGDNKKSGRNYIIFEVIKKSIFDFLAIEEALIINGDKIKILAIEKSFEQSINIPGLNFPIKIVGVVDRMDEFNGNLRIIDYKTAEVNPQQLRLTDWNHLRENSSFSYLFQILIYSYFHSYEISQYDKSYAGIISFRNLPEYFMPFEIKTHDSHSLCEKKLKNFEKILFELINEIFNSKMKFKKSVFESF